MTETEFRVKHSELIEYYQLIEMRLKGICAAVLADEEKGWFERLSDYDSDPFGKLLKLIKDLQKEKDISVFAQEELDALNQLRLCRNYWVHQCFACAERITFKKGEVAKKGAAVQLHRDYEDAFEWDKKLTETECKLHRGNPFIGM